MLFNIWSRLSYFTTDFSLYLVLVILSCVTFILIGFKIYKSKLKPTGKKILISAAFSIFIAVIVYSAFEAYFRYVYDESDGLGFLKTNARWHQRHVVTNNYFFRDRDFNTQKEEGVIRIGVLGDSITFGGGIESPEDRFSNLLETKLREQNRKVEVYNMGKLGSDTEEQIKEYEKVKHLNFDIIVWQYFLNDVQPQGASTGTPIISRNSQKAEIIKQLSDKSFFFDFIYWRFSSKYRETFEQLKEADLNQYQNRDVFEKHKEEMKNFIEELKSEDKKIIVITFPFIHLLGPDYPSKNIHTELSDFFSNQNVESIDLLEYLKDQNPMTLIASKFDSHPNEKVHKIAADLLFEKVSSLLKDSTLETSPR